MGGNRRRGGAPGGLRDLRGVGPSLAEDLESLGVRCPEDLSGADPEALYRRLCAKTGERQDRCVLYVFRCAVYQASHARPDRALCDWWAWKDGGLASRRGVAPC